MASPTNTDKYPDLYAVYDTANERFTPYEGTLEYCTKVASKRAHWEVRRNG